MKRTVTTAVMGLLLGIGAHAQTDEHENMPGMQMPFQQMEMHSPQEIGAHVADVQEPENPNQKTGSNLPVPDLLEAAKAVPAKNLDDFEAAALRNNPTLKQAEAITRL